MSVAPQPQTLFAPREDWADADFDIPEGVPLHAPSDREEEDDEDWDLEMDLGQTGGAKAKAVVAGIAARLERTPLAAPTPRMFTIRPPIKSLNIEEDEDEGVSTIKATTVKASTIRPAGLSSNTKPKVPKQPLQPPIDEDFEDGFSLPSDLTTLSLAPKTLIRQPSKASLEWGDKDSSASTSSQSSGAYSTFGFVDDSPLSQSNTTASLPETETEDEEDDLEGLVIPSALFESKQSARHLNKLLETKKKAEPTIDPVAVPTPNPEDDFEAGLIIEDDVELSPSRLLTSSQQAQRAVNRNGAKTQRQSAASLRAPSRKLDRSKSPSNPPPSSQRQLQKIRLSPPPPLRPPPHSQAFQAFGPPPPIPSPMPSPSSNFLTPKPGSLRGQKSHIGFKPPTPPSTARKLTRKASMSVIESSQKQAPRTSVEIKQQAAKLARYEEPTMASKAKSLKTSASRMHDLKVPPTRPSTPSSNPIALRLTMPTQSKLKSRPSLSQVFGQAPDPQSVIPPVPSRTASSSRTPSGSLPKPSPIPASPPPPSLPKLLKKPKRARTYGDGTELDALDDLPLDQDKESRYRVHPKGQSNRIPGASFEKMVAKPTGDRSGEAKQSTIRRSKGQIIHNDSGVLTAATNTPRRATIALGSPPRPASNVVGEAQPKKRKSQATSPNATRRKPTLIRNLGGAGGPKVIGDMKWNPSTLRWEGNDHVLREFDAAMGTSTRPALITQLTGSSLGSPSGSFTNGARVVGNMYFDPQQMRWISTLPSDEEEPDVFANMADDEDTSDAGVGKSGTLRPQGPRASDASSVTSGAESIDMICPSRGLRHSRTISDSGSDDRGSRASMYMGDIDDEFIEKCRQAEVRHRSEMKGWKTAQDPHRPPTISHLYEIRALATRKY